MDKNEKNKLSDLLFTIALCIAFGATLWSYNKRFEILECRLQVQTARIDGLSGLEITRPECFDELIGPLKEPAKKPVKRA